MTPGTLLPVSADSSSVDKDAGRSETSGQQGLEVGLDAERPQRSEGGDIRLRKFTFDDLHKFGKRIVNLFKNRRKVKRRTKAKKVISLVNDSPLKPVVPGLPLASGKNSSAEAIRVMRCV